MKRIEDDLLTVHAERELERARTRANKYARKQGVLLPVDKSLFLFHLSVRAPYVMVSAKMSGGTPADFPLGVGFAKCSPHDKFDPSVGISIAAFRAVRDLAS